MKLHSRNSRRRGRRLSAQIFVIAIVATMLLTVMPLSNRASADDSQIVQSNATETAQQAVDDQSTTVDEVVDEPQATETVTPEPTIPVDNQNVDNAVDQVVDDPKVDGGQVLIPTEGSSSITINKHVCYGPVDGNIYNMAASCQGADQVYTFNLFFGDAPWGTAQTSGSIASFGGLPAGTFYVEEVPSANFDSAMVFCSVKDFAGNPVRDLYPSYIWNWKIEAHLETDGDMMFCDWFNYNSTPAQTTGSVIINKIVCPLGFDAYSTDIYGIAANCHETPAPTTFTVTDANGGQQTGATAASAPYSVQFDNVPSGALTIDEQLPAGFGTPRVFCKNESYTGSGDGELEVQVSGASAATELKAGYDYLWCDWVNIPLSQVDIYINKHMCPEGYMSTDPYDLAYNCQEQFDPFTFSVNGNLTGPAGQQQTGDVVPGAVQFSGLPADTWTVVEDLPSGYGTPVVFCKLINIDGSESSYDLAQLTGDSAISFDIASGYTLFCDWYNFPANGYGSITIYKHTCPAGYDVNAYGANPWLDCPDLTNGVTFTLSHGADVPLQTMTGDSIDGAVYWGGLMADPYQVQETFPADTAYAFVFGCSSDVTGGYAPTDLVGIDGTGSFSLELAQGQHLVCHWYNVPALHGGTVVITKYWCDGSVYSVVACDRYEQGASFQLTTGGGSGVQVTTGIDGTVAVELAAGAYDLTEVGGTWCHAEASNVDAAGNIVVADGQTTTVTVFNCGPREVPQGKPTPGKFPNTGIGPIASEQPAS